MIDLTACKKGKFSEFFDEIKKFKFKAFEALLHN